MNWSFQRLNFSATILPYSITLKNRAICIFSKLVYYMECILLRKFLFSLNLFTMVNLDILNYILQPNSLYYELVRHFDSQLAAFKFLSNFPIYLPKKLSFQKKKILLRYFYSGFQELNLSKFIFPYSNFLSFIRIFLTVSILYWIISI